MSTKNGKTNLTLSSFVQELFSATFSCQICYLSQLQSPTTTPKLTRIMEENNGLETRLVEREEATETENEKSIVRRSWEESRLVWRTAFPAVLFRLSVFGVQVVTQSFIGHISQVELAAYSLVQSITVKFANGVLIGMSSATETLCGQAFGAKHYRMMGIYLQRSWIINLITAIFLLPIYIFSAKIYRLLGQEDDIADASEGISLWYIGVIFGFVFTLTTESFLQAQRKNMFIGLVSPITFVLHIFISWIFVTELGWGVAGAMSVLVISRAFFAFSLLVYMFGGWCNETWTGFSMEAFHDLVPIVKLSISSGVMLCVQLWYTSILVLLAGYTSDATVSIDAFTICLNISNWQYMICLGFMGAACVRVANELGKGNAKAARFAIKVILSTTVALAGVVFSVLCLVLRDVIPYWFTSDDEVAEASSNLFVLLSITMLLNSFQAILSGVAIGTGSQTKVAYVNIISYYLIGIPIGCVLAYVADYGITGIWIGLICGIVTQGIFLAYVTLKIDWTNEIDRATQRLNRYNLDRDQKGKENSSAS